MNARLLRLSAAGLLFSGLLPFGGNGAAAQETAKPEELKIVVTEEVLKTPATPPLVTAIEPSSFEEVTAHLDKGGLLYSYLSTEQWFSGLSSYIASFRDAMLPPLGGEKGAAKRERIQRDFDTVTELTKRSGLEAVTGVGSSSIALSPGLYRNKLFVHHRKTNGFLWTAFGALPHRWEALDFLPADTALASFADLDLPQLAGIARQAIEQSGNLRLQKKLDAALVHFVAMTGMPLEEALQSLGGSAGMVLTLDPLHSMSVTIDGKEQMVPVPRLALLFKVKDDRIFNQIDKTLAANPFVMRVEEPNLRMRTLPFPLVPQLTARATAAMWGGYLILATDDKLVRDFVATRNDGKGLKAAPEFAKLSAGLPEVGDGFHFVSQRFADASNRFREELVKNHPGTTPFPLMQKLLAFEQAAASFSVSTHLENGWLAIGNGTMSGPQMLQQMLMAPTVMAAGMAGHEKHAP